MDSKQKVFLIRRVMFALTLVGLFISTYLLVTYVSGAPIVCGASHGCEIVRASKWATSLGLPRPLLGVVFYAALALLIIIRTALPLYYTRWLYRLSMLAVTIGFVESAFLTFVQWLDIKAFCIWCVASAIVATALFVMAWWDKPVESNESALMKELKFQFFTLFVAVVLGTIGILAMVVQRTDGEKPVLREPSVTDEQREQAEALLWPVDATYEGPTDASVTVTEFIDLECPACATFHPEMNDVREAYKGKIRFLYRHFPLPIHPHAKLAAQGAVCAEEQGSLFDFVDQAIDGQEALGRDDLIAIAAELRLDLGAFVPCLDGDASRLRVEKDIQDGKALGVSQTPTIFVNTAMIDGLPSSEQLTDIIDQFID